MNIRLQELMILNVSYNNNDIILSSLNIFHIDIHTYIHTFNIYVSVSVCVLFTILSTSVTRISRYILEGPVRQKSHANIKLDTKYVFFRVEMR